MVIVIVTCLPLLVLPTMLPYRSGEGSWFGGILVRLVRIVYNNINFHTGLLLCLAVWFFYHMDGIE